jgi:hypothetical protein
MKKENRSIAVAIAFVLIAIGGMPLPAAAQQVTGELGSPRSKTWIDYLK